MSSFAVASIALRILAVWTLFVGLENLAWGWNPGAGDLPARLGFLGACAAVAAALALGSGAGARVLLRGVPAAPGEPAGAPEAHAIALSVTGLAVLVAALQRALFDELVHGTSALGAVLHVPALLLGLVVFLRPVGVARLARAFRELGVADPPRDAPGPHPLQAAAFSVVGLWFLLRGLLDLANVGSVLTGGAPASVIVRMAVPAAAGLAAGTLCFAGSARVSALWQRLNAARGPSAG